MKIKRKKKFRVLCWIMKIIVLCIILIGLNKGKDKVIEKKVENFSKNREIKELKKNRVYAEVKNNLITIFFFNITGIRGIEDVEGIGNFYTNLAVIKKGEKYGLVKTSGSLALPIEYDGIHLGEMGEIIYIKDNVYYKGLKNPQVLDVDSLYQIDSKRLIYIKDKKMGVMNFLGEIIIPNEYDEISPNIDEFFIGGKNEKYSIYNTSNEKVSAEYDYIEELDKNTYKMGTLENGKFAFFNKNQETYEIYESIGKVSNDYYIAEMKYDTTDIIHSSGNVVSIKKEDVKKYLEELLK